MGEDLKLQFDLYCRKLKQTGIDTLLERGMDTVSVVSAAIAKPTPASITRAAMSVARTLTGSDMYYMDVFDTKEWKPVFPNCIKRQVMQILEKQVTTKLKIGADSEAMAHFIVRDNVKIAWVRDGDDGNSTDVLAHVSCYDSSKDFARDLLWRTIDPTRIVITNVKTNRPTSPGEHGQLSVNTDDLIEGVPSKFSEDYAPYLKKCIEHNINRTILFYGPPGSGKSTISRTLCDMLNLKSLRVRVEDVNELGSEALIEMIEIFKPDVVIFDDLDRAISQVALLETLETLHKRVRFVFSTVNHVEHLQPAVVRPGRFDELIEITKLDERAVRKALGEFTDVVDQVGDWPIAFINEYVIRRKMLGKEKALATIKELKRRVEMLDGTNSSLYKQQATVDKPTGEVEDESLPW